MLIEFSITKQRRTFGKGLWEWEEMGFEFTTTSIQTICDDYAKLHNEDEALVIKYLEKDRKVILVLNKENLTILIGSDYQGKRKTKEIENVLYEFLETLIYNKSFCGINTKEILFDLERK